MMVPLGDVVAGSTARLKFLRLLKRLSGIAKIYGSGCVCGPAVLRNMGSKAVGSLNSTFGLSVRGLLLLRPRTMVASTCGTRSRGNQHVGRAKLPVLCGVR